VAIILPPQPWTRQPQVPTGVNWAHPLARYLKWLSPLGADNRDLVSNKLITLATGQFVSVNKNGRCLETPASLVATSNNLDLSAVGSKITVSFWANFSAFANNQTAPIKFTNNDGGAQEGFEIQYDYDGSTFVVYGYSASNFWKRGFNKPALGLHHIMMTFDRTQSYCGATLYVDGVNFPATWDSASGSTGSWGNGPFRLGALFTNGGNPSTFQLQNVTVLGGYAGTAQDAIREYTYPWQLFAPLPRRIFVGPSAGGAYTVTADAGSYALSGQAATLTKNSVLTADAGSYSLSGQAATLSWAGAGAFTLTADAGSYALSGQNATLTWASPGAYVLTADAGSYTMSGQSATLLKSNVLTAAAGAYSLSGQAATLSWAAAAAYTLTANAGSYILQGQSAVLTNSGEVITTTAPTEPNSIDWGALVAKTWGKDYVKPEWDYEFSNGRRFLEKKNPYA
jgi:hypothetical protein